MGEKGVMAVAVDDLGEGMQCSDHPYRSNPGGICAFCLQEKLGKLVSSSNSTNPSFFPPLPLFSSSNSSSPSFRRDFGGGGDGVFVLKRSKSVAPKPTGEIRVGISEDSPRRKKRFWSFYLSSSTNHCSRRSTDLHPKITAADEESSVKNEETDTDSRTSSSSFGRKVARSRSVGCGSRSFSGDFLERISTGLGDCTLRRVESQREPNKNAKMVIKDTVKCGGIFGGLGMISSSYWLSAADVENFGSTSTRAGSRRSRGWGWGWALASPMRAFRPISGSKSTGGRIGNGNSSSLSVGGN